MKLRTCAMIEGLAASIDSDTSIEEIDAIALVLADVATSSAVPSPPLRADIASFSPPDVGATFLSS